jgi:hypothetical protein
MARDSHSRRPIRGLFAAGQPIAWALALLLPAPLIGWSTAVQAQSVVAGTPVVCTTSWEAPPALPRSGFSRGSQLPPPVLISRCQRGQNIPELMERRMMTHTAPYAPGVSLGHQVTDLFGIAMGGLDGANFMGLGFPDQTIVWDGTAVENTYRALLEEQSQPLAWRTADVSSGFSSNLSAGPGGELSSSEQMVPWQNPPVRRGATVRGLW